jgi:magnesium transporter
MTSNMLLRAPHSLLYNSFHTDNITGPVVLHITKFDLNGNYEIDVVKKSQLLMSHKLQPRDIRFTAPSLLYVRQSSIIMRLLHIKAIINPKNVILLESDHPTIVSFIPELKEKLSNNLDMLPFELRVVEALLTKMFAELEDNLNELQPSIVNVLDNLLDPQFHTIDRAQLHILLYQSNRLSEFNSLVKDIQVTLSDMLEYEEDLASMYLTHNSLSDEERSVDDIEEVENILEAFLMQTEDMLSRVQRLRDLIDQSENIILINLDSLRNIMLRLSLQLEMGTFSATIGGLFGLAFGMNLNSSLEDVRYIVDHNFAIFNITDS